MLIEYVDGTIAWLPLSLVKESNPVELAQYAVSCDIDSEPAFAWWVNHTLKKRTRIINKLWVQTHKQSMKFGVTIPTNCDEAVRLNRENKNNLWEQAIKKELKNVKIAFQLLENDKPLPVGSMHIPYHIIFDVKYDLTRTARLVAGGTDTRMYLHIYLICQWFLGKVLE